MNYLLFVFFSLTGGFIGYKLKLPMGAILGSMFFVGSWKLLTHSSFSAAPVMTFAIQVMLGTIIGLSFSNFDKNEMKKIFHGMIVISIGVFLMIYLTSWMLNHFSGLSFSVSIISAAPGSIAEMATLAAELNLEPSVVLAMHLTRVIIVVFLLSSVVNYMRNKIEKSKEEVI